VPALKAKAQRQKLILALGTMVPKSFKKLEHTFTFGELVLMLDVSSLPIPLALVPSSYSAFPYIVMLLGVIIAIAALLIVFPSLRKYRRKRNILIYLVAALVIVLLVFQIDNVSRRAVVSYAFAGDPKYYDREGNQLIIQCQNHGDRTASFYLVLSSVNATFQVKTQQDYIQTSSRTVKVPFLLQESWLSMSANSKSVFFTIDENVTGFSFSMSLEAQGYGSLVVASGDTDERFVWNGTENCYILSGGGGFT
jgi:hypothetical protein